LPLEEQVSSEVPKPSRTHPKKYDHSSYLNGILILPFKQYIILYVLKYLNVIISRHSLQISSITLKFKL
jgi:hypothetical protein